jgi:CBS domain-containing protein
VDPKPPLRFPGSFAVDHEGKLDIKRRGIIPIVNLARFHAIAAGITISATVDRLEAAAESGALAPDVADGIKEALGIVAHVRLQHHAAQIAAGEAVDNMVDPAKLPPVLRRELREAFRVVAAAQKRVANSLPQGA